MFRYVNKDKMESVMFDGCARLEKIYEQKLALINSHSHCCLLLQTESVKIYLVMWELAPDKTKINYSITQRQIGIMLHLHFPMFHPGNRKS